MRPDEFEQMDVEVQDEVDHAESRSGVRQGLIEVLFEILDVLDAG
jgi:hypothetical protein